MSNSYLPWLDPNTLTFPPVNQAWDEPNGVLAVGGDLSVARLVNAYCQGIFPWYSEDEPILWWSPNPRCVVRPEAVKVSKSLRKLINKNCFTVTYDQCFANVITACAAPRKDLLDSGSSGTWISADMKQAYIDLHHAGYAHSVEVWLDDQLVGGLYGIAIGKVFFGESMFSRVSNASKVGFVTFAKQLVDRGFELIDGQVESDHLLSLGFELIDRKDFIKQLQAATATPSKLSL